VVNSNDDERAAAESYNNTRRQFVAGSAGAVAGLAIGGGFAGSVLADEHEDGENGENDEEMPESDFEDDVDILNYALTLEYLQASFYRQGLENLDEEDFCNCQALTEESYLQQQAYSELETILEQEEEHVATLTSVIESLDGEPVEEPEFDFGMAVQYPMAFLSTAAQLEDVGVSAYAGAAPSIESGDILPPALGIHSVEARHAAFLRTLTGQTGFPNVIDEARSRPEVMDIASDFIADGMPDWDDEDGDGEDEENGGEGDGEGDGDSEGDGEESAETATDMENGTETAAGNETETNGT
jgi:rubrerythrin